MRTSVRFVLSDGAVGQVAQPVVRLVTIAMPRVRHACRPRAPERSEDQSVYRVLDTRVWLCECHGEVSVGFGHEF